MASKKLVRLAKAAAVASAKAQRANIEWVEAFKSEYGHDDISDALVEVVDYSGGDTACLTAEFIHHHSGAGKS